MLKDLHGRQFRYLRLSVTERCNFRCSYCLPDGYQCSSKTAPLSINEIRNAVHAFAAQGIKKVRLTGGEPSLRRDLPEIIRTVKETAGIEEVAITSNGHHLARHLPKWEEAGLDQLNLSIDSLTPELFHRITGFDQLHTLLSDLDRVLESDVIKKVKINTVLLRQSNRHEFARFVEWVRDKPLTLRFIELMETGDNGRFFDKQHQRCEPLMKQLVKAGWQPVIKSATAGPAQELWHPNYRGRIGFIAPYSKDFCASCNRLRLSATGKLHLCLFSEAGLDLRPLLSGEDPTALAQMLQRLMHQKAPTHQLHQHISGATTHLAMLGG